MTDYLDFNEAA